MANCAMMGRVLVALAVLPMALGQGDLLVGQDHNPAINNVDMSATMMYKPTEEGLMAAAHDDFMVLDPEERLGVWEVDASERAKESYAMSSISGRILPKSVLPPDAEGDEAIDWTPPSWFKTEHWAKVWDIFDRPKAIYDTVYRSKSDALQGLLKADKRYMQQMAWQGAQETESELVQVQYHKEQKLDLTERFKMANPGYGHRNMGITPYTLELDQYNFDWICGREFPCVVRVGAPYSLDLLNREDAAWVRAVRRIKSSKIFIGNIRFSTQFMANIRYNRGLVERLGMFEGYDPREVDFEANVEKTMPFYFCVPPNGGEFTFFSHLSQPPVKHSTVHLINWVERECEIRLRPSANSYMDYYAGRFMWRKGKMEETLAEAKREYKRIAPYLASDKKRIAKMYLDIMAKTVKDEMFPFTEELKLMQEQEEAGGPVGTAEKRYVDDPRGLMLDILIAFTDPEYIPRLDERDVTFGPDPPYEPLRKLRAFTSAEMGTHTGGYNMDMSIR